MKLGLVDESIRPGGRGGREVPTSALVVSVLALGVAAGGNLFWSERLPHAFALLWLLALIPPFLLAYYRGWEGAALALAAGMVLLVGVEVGGSYLTDRAVRWWAVTGIVAVLIVVSLGAGAIADRLHRREWRALEMAYGDPLTGLPNRRILDFFLARGFAAAERGAKLCVVIFDIDEFKALNDSQGHASGDAALRLIGRVLEANTRASDVSGRLGGDEFLSVLAGEELEGGESFAWRVLRELEAWGARTEKGITVSAGVAAYDPRMGTVAELLDVADEWLYRAKRSGGSRVMSPRGQSLIETAGREVREGPTPTEAVDLAG